MTSGEESYKPYQPGMGAYAVAVILGSAGSIALATFWLNLSPTWLALLLGAVCALLGTLSGDNVGDATMFSVIVGLIIYVFISFGPEIGAVRAGIVPVGTGLCAGKLVVGVFKEASP